MSGLRTASARLVPAGRRRGAQHDRNLRMSARAAHAPARPRRIPRRATPRATRYRACSVAGAPSEALAQMRPVGSLAQTAQQQHRECQRGQQNQQQAVKAAHHPCGRGSTDAAPRFVAGEQASPGGPGESVGRQPPRHLLQRTVQAAQMCGVRPAAAAAHAAAIEVDDADRAAGADQYLCALRSA